MSSGGAASSGWIEWTSRRPVAMVGLEIEAGDDVLAQHEGQAVIAVFALGRGVDFDAVAEVEQALGAGALPHDGVEGRYQGPGVDPARQLGLGSR